MKKYKIEIKRNDARLDIQLYEKDKLVEVYTENENKMRLEGNIYLGTVKDIVKGMQAAFIDIGEEKNALIHIKDLVEKESLSTGNVNLDIEKYDIEKLVKVGEKILVQIKRDCDDQKGSRVTKDIKLTGKYSVIMPYSNFITVSSKIIAEEERIRLKKIACEACKEKFGVIIRTSAEEKDADLIIKDINNLIMQWKKILYEYENQNNDVKIIPKMLYNNNGILGKLITDFETTDLEIFADSLETKKYVLEKLGNAGEDINIKVKDIEDIPEMPRKIWLKCGGFITIDKCEALTAIDVNSGKFTGKSQLEDTVLKVNLEATEEIARQIRLRDIGGIIIVDYIDMNEEQDREKVKEAMKNAIKKDRSKVQILEFTKLGLLEITRKHILGR